MSRLRVIGLVAGAVAAGALAYGLLSYDGSTASTPLPDLFEPSPGTSVPSESVRGEVDGSIEALLAQPRVRIDGVGYSSGRRSDLTVDLDRSRRALHWRELISPAASIGEPASETPTVSEYVLIDDIQFVRMLQPGQDPGTPYQGVIASDFAAKLIDGAYVEGGRLFDSLEVLRRALREVPFTAERLEPRVIGGTRASGVRVVFDTEAVGDFLAGTGLEVVGSHAHDDAGTTNFELWYSAGQLRELVATGHQFFDGEEIADVAVRLTYRTGEFGPIEAPTNTVP